MAELAVLQHARSWRSAISQLDRGEPGAQQRARVAGAEVGAALRLGGVALAHHALDDLEHRARVGRGWRLSPRPSARIASAIAACAHFAALPCAPCAIARPARMWARNSSGVAAARGLGEGPADVDSGVVVGAADGGAAVGLDVHDAGRFSSFAREPLRVSQIGNSCARRRRWRAVSGAATA